MKSFNTNYKFALANLFGAYLDILFATSNEHKFIEAKEILENVNLKQFDFSYTEIRSDNIEDIARDAASAAYKRVREPVFVEDSGLFIKALNEFPGTYSKWAFNKIGNEGILKLLQGETNRTAIFEARIAFVRRKEEIRIFRGVCEGTISFEARGDDGFGFDPIFIPLGEDQTFAESKQLKNKLSHRYKALLEFYNSLSHRN